MSSHFEPAKYRDVYREDLLRLIDEKIAAGAVNTIAEGEQAVPAARPQENVVDLVALLRQSIERKPPKAAPPPEEAAQVEAESHTSGKRQHGKAAKTASTRLKRSA